MRTAHVLKASTVWILQVVFVFFLALSLASPALAASPAKHPPHKRHHYSNNGSVPGYGFLPGVRTPQPPFFSGMTIMRGNSAPAPQRPSDCVFARSMETVRPAVTFRLSGCVAS